MRYLEETKLLLFGPRRKLTLTGKSEVDTPKSGALYAECEPNTHKSELFTPIPLSQSEFSTQAHGLSGLLLRSVANLYFPRCWGLAKVRGDFSLEFRGGDESGDGEL